MSQQLEQVKALIQLREKARLGGSQKRIDSQHQKDNSCVNIFTENRRENSNDH